MTRNPADAPEPVITTGERFVGLPPTFGAAPQPTEPDETLVFDPSTLQYSRAYRRGDPKLPEDEMKRWYAARREVMQHLLTIATTSPWGANLVLRGSLALKAALGTLAREPGDIDWVVQPDSLQMKQAEARRMMDGVIRAVTVDPKCGETLIDIDAITRNDIWTYDRAPGHRIAFPWQCGNLPPAVVQMDFVFQQKLLTAAEETVIRLDAHLPEVLVVVASEEESLAWKILWLFSDMHPQGKDLYDAVLLAEKNVLSGPLLKSVFEDAGCWKDVALSSSFPFNQGYREVADWENFLKECPWVGGTAQEWADRLINAIGPAVTALQAGHSTNADR